MQSVLVPIAVGAWSAVCLSAVARAEHPEFMHGMDDEVTFRRIQDLEDLPFATACWAAMMPADPSTSLGVYEPGTVLFRLLLARALGSAPRVFAIAGTLLHGVAIALAASNAELALRKLKLDTFRLALWVSAAFLGSHPMRAEVVCWSSCHGYLLATIFCLLSFRCRITECPIGEFLFLGIALLCKAAVVTVPLLFWAWEVASADEVVDVAMRAFVRQLRYLPLILGCVFSALCAAEGAPADVRELSFGESLLRASFATCFYLWRTLVPPWHWTTPRFALPEEFSAPEFVVAVVFVAGATLLPPALHLTGAFGKNSWRWLWLAWAAYVALLLPTLGVSSHVWALAADRYVYLPSLCLFIPCLTAVLHRCQEMLESRMLLVLVLPLLAASSWRGNEVASHWSHDSTFLFKAILKERPAEFNTLKDLGTLQLKQGQASAKVTLSEALKIRPDHAGVLLNMATLLHRSKAFKEAEEMYQRANSAASARTSKCHSCQPAMTELVKVQANYGGLLLQLGRASEAVAVLEAGAPWDDAVDAARAIGLHHLCLARRALGLETSAYRACRAGGLAKEAQALHEKEVLVDGLR